MILQAKHLTKRYGDYMAVDDIQLEFEKGSFKFRTILTCFKFNHIIFSSFILIEEIVCHDF